jgi:hypothetical protein
MSVEKYHENIDDTHNYVLDRRDAKKLINDWLRALIDDFDELRETTQDRICGASIPPSMDDADGDKCETVSNASSDVMASKDDTDATLCVSESTICTLYRVVKIVKTKQNVDDILRIAEVDNDPWNDEKKRAKDKGGDISGYLLEHFQTDVSGCLRTPS